MNEYDLIVVGAGIARPITSRRIVGKANICYVGVFGLIAAHTWLSLDPNSKVLLLESGPDLGYSPSRHVTHSLNQF